MRKFGLWLAAIVLAGVASTAGAAPSERARLKQEAAARVTIVRDDGGIAHTPRATCARSTSIPTN